ncbi:MULTISPECIES: TnsA-like heteromeric transposase endonuclease subunit [unclassified Streptomyces]|uniref:TnsA-like heteromeric transposase endonuclease subunit n=2 Tax=unclassified Streptomyces TaxID=2593676 RepID=UPI002E2E1A03|nr:TnsA-like heteromeric transposase endonuclease subunit [Streptomyces sp. GF20]
MGGASVHLRQVDVRFVGPDGVMVQRPWRSAAGGLCLMECPMVRSFPLRRGRRLAPGWWWSATTSHLVGYGSAAMRDAVMMLDQDPQVTGMVSRPVELVWEEGGRTVTHAPDLAVALVDGSIHLVDCPGSSGPSARLASRARVAGLCAQDVGWEHRFADAADPVALANGRWLSVYRHPRCSAGIPAARLREAFASPIALFEGALRLGDPIATLPAVYHGLWHGLLSMAWDHVLSEETPVVAVPARRRREGARR